MEAVKPSCLMLALIVALFPAVICQQRTEIECAQNLSLSSQNFSMYCPTEALGMELDVSRYFWPCYNH